jgi:mannose-6-phosphate isomerase-like protein (cupin superfamily)
MPGTVDLAAVLPQIQQPWGPRTIRMDDGDVTLGPGQLHVVPKGTPHQPFSPDGAEVFLVEPSTTVNAGDTPSELTAERRV